MDYLAELNEVQKQAVEHIDGPLLVIAGPGSGKTRVLTYRIAYLVHQGIDPFNILALTFTNKAAREMKERIEKVTGPEARNLWMGTFHSVFARILRIEGPKLGFPSNFSIYDTDDSRNLIKTIVKERGLNDSLYKANIVHNRISAAKNSLIGPKQYQDEINLVTEDEASGRPRLGELYELYAKRCFKAGAMDFDDLLFKMYLLLKQFPDALYKYQQKFHYILIDEFQDTNAAQYTIVKMLADVFENVCVVGDDAQSIYSFRGANIQNILDFEKDYPDLKVYKLEQNYRSTKRIVDAANEIITNNKNQLAKTIWTENGMGVKVKVMRGMSDNEEGRLIADNIYEEKLRNHYVNNDFAILYRTNAQSRSFEEAFRRLNIPYRVYGGISFYQRKEIKNFLGYLRIVINPNDEEALRRVINYPTRGIGKTTINQLTVIADDNDISIWEVIKEPDLYFTAPRTRNALKNFRDMIRSFMTMIDDRDAFDLAMYIAKQTDVLNELYKDKTIEGLSHYENLQELLNSIKEFTTTRPESVDEAVPEDKSLGSYLQQVTLLTDLDDETNEADSVKLMTIHSAKGLEFNAVYIVGVEENLFPSLLSINSREDLEEERRLFYVAVTRAKKKLALSYASTRYRFGTLTYCEPSRFIDELPSEHVDMPPPARRQLVASQQMESKLSYSKMPRKVSGYQHKASPNFMPDDPLKLQVGMEVEHQRFGYGKVISMDGKNESRIANIFFKEVGSKRIMLKYARLRFVPNSSLTD